MRKEQVRELKRFSEPATKRELDAALRALFKPELETTHFLPQLEPGPHEAVGDFFLHEPRIPPMNAALHR